MSEKMTNKKRRKSQWWKIVLLIICLAALCAEVYWIIQLQQRDATVVIPPVAVPQQTDAPVSVQPEVSDGTIDLGNGMRITEVGEHTGFYVEDGSDEAVSGIMTIVVTNEGEEDIRYAEISMPVGDQTARFTLSTLPAGGTVVLQELNRIPYVEGEYTTAVAEHVMLFREPLELCEDRLTIQILDGAINVANISGEDITEDILIYYKYMASDVYYGGITFRVRIEGGMKADEQKHITASHFYAADSVIMFVTCEEN